MPNYRDRRLAREILKKSMTSYEKVRDPRVQEVNITDVHVTRRPATSDDLL